MQPSLSCEVCASKLSRSATKYLINCSPVGFRPPSIDHCVRDGVRSFDESVPYLAEDVHTSEVEDDNADQVESEHYHLQSEDYHQISGSSSLSSVCCFIQRLVSGLLHLSVHLSKQDDRDEIWKDGY